jgi:hypothetical protein
MMKLKGLLLCAGLLLGLLFVSACSEKKEMPEGLLFAGSCKVEVQSMPKNAEIFIDGISVGHGKAQVHIPCGEKQVLVEQKGFTPYYAYHKVEEGRALKVSVTLKEMSKSHESFALSREIVEQLREGLQVWDPSKGPRPERKEGEEYYPPYMGDMKALIASVKGGTSAAAGSGGEEFETGTWDSVEDWR